MPEVLDRIDWTLLAILVLLWASTGFGVWLHMGWEQEQDAKREATTYRRRVGLGDD